MGSSALWQLTQVSSVSTASSVLSSSVRSMSPNTTGRSSMSWQSRRRESAAARERLRLPTVVS